MLKIKYIAVILLFGLFGCGSSGDSETNESTKTLKISGTPGSNVDEESAYSFQPSVERVDSSALSFSITNKPNWATFSSDTGLLSGTPDDPDVGEHTSIEIKVEQAGQTATLEPFSISVTAINDAPVISNEKFEVQYNEEFSGVVTVTDPDSTDLQFTLVQTSTKGALSLDTATGEFSYEPPGNIIDLDTFTVKVSDGFEDSEEVVIQLDIIDSTSPKITSSSPMNEARRILIDTDLNISFDDVMDSDSFTFTSDDSCSGSIQLSNDGFQSCIPISDLSTDGNDVVVSVATTLDKNTNYELQLSSEIKNIAGLALEARKISFKTARSLVITEVGSSYHTDALSWFEIYNDYPIALNLQDYQLRSLSSDLDTYSEAGIKTFDLPNVMIEPGAYFVVSAQSKYDAHNDTENRVYIQDGNIIPYWALNGFVEIIDIQNNLTEDFIEFGADLTEPLSGTAWSGDFVAAMPARNDAPYGYAYSRSLDLTDTNTKDDWEILDHATPGFANDIRCSADIDEDGIPDCTEIEGSTYAGMPLYEWGARVGQKDIFIEIDSMISDDEGVRPRQEALDMVVRAFAARGFSVHFDAGDMFDNADGLNPDKHDLGGGNDIPFADGLDMNGWTGGGVSLFEYKANFFDFKRKQIFHYMIFGGSQKADGSAGSSGYAEILGNDSIVTLGGWGLHSDDADNLNGLINFQAGTLMHELGHNLGLRHGGFNNVNNKPNYFSVMNYLYQLRGLSTIGNQEGDRYYRRFFRDNATCEVPLLNGFFTDYNLFRIDYSDGTSEPLDENSVSETLGLGRAGSTSVDYNCNGVIDAGTYALDLNQDGSNETLFDFNDWGAIELVFSRYWNGNGEGTDKSATLNSDQQETIQEEEPSAEFFEALKRKTQ